MFVVLRVPCQDNYNSNNNSNDNNVFFSAPFLLRGTRPITWNKISFKKRKKKLSKYLRREKIHTMQQAIRPHPPTPHTPPPPSTHTQRPMGNTILKYFLKVQMPRCILYTLLHSYLLSSFLLPLTSSSLLPLTGLKAPTN